MSKRRSTSQKGVVLGSAPGTVSKDHHDPGHSEDDQGGAEAVPRQAKKVVNRVRCRSTELLRKSLQPLPVWLSG